MSRFGRLHYELVAIASLAGALFCASAAEGGGAPAAQDPTDAAEAVAPMLVRIEKARIGADPQPALVMAALKEALAAIDNAEAALRTSRAGVEESIAREPRKQANRQQAAERQRLRIREAQAALARGDVYRIAALALPKDSPDRAEYLGRAVQVFDALRVEYRDLTVGLLGYIGEARAQRAAGRLDAAAAALKPVLNVQADPKEPSLMEVRRAAFLEVLEISLAANPAKALTEAAGLAQSAAVKDVPLWQARIDYVIARAEAAEVEKAATAGPLPPSAVARAARAAAILRREAVIQIAPAFDRMAMLAKLDRFAGGKLLTRDELLQWADMLAATGRPEAIDAYRRALAGGPLPVEQSVVYVSLLIRQGKFLDAADACDDLLKRMDPAHAQRGMVLQCRAATLLKLLQTVQPAPESLRTRAAESLRAAFESTLDAAVRRDALRQWVALQGSRGSLASCIATLQANPTLVSGDPYLEYSLVAGKWQKLSEESGRRAGSSTGAEDTIAIVQARGIADEAAALEKCAVQGNLPDITARAALLRAQVLAGAPLRDSRTALTVLTAQWDALRAEPATAAPAGWLRVELMMNLGLVDAASKALAELPDGGSPDSPLALLRLAEALAGRAASMPPEAQGEVQREVLKFSGRAMSMAVSNPATFRAVRERAARAMFAAGAIADAQRVLTDLLAEEETRKDPRALLDNSLLLAQTLERSGKPEESLKRLDGLTDPKTGPVPGRYADSAALCLARSRCLAVLGQHEQSVASARQARGLSAPGSEEWCRATLALAEGLAAQGNTQAAADILRVAAALYPTFANTELRGRLKQLRENLETRSATQGRAPVATRENPS